jgi:hypothetical protein
MGCSFIVLTLFLSCSSSVRLLFARCAFMVRSLFPDCCFVAISCAFSAWPARHPAVPGGPPGGRKPARGQPRHKRQTAGGGTTAAWLCLSTISNGNSLVK